MQVDLVVLSLGGVQRFISESRSTADVAGASKIVRDLVRLGAAVVEQRLAGSDEPCGLIFPGAADAHSVSNKIVFLAAAGAGPGIARAAAEKICDGWHGELAKTFKTSQPPGTPGMPDLSWVSIMSDLDTMLFGSPRPGCAAEAGRGSVVIWDGLPIDSPELALDVLTPHVKGYYDGANSTNKPTVPPAEYHNPVPIRFLAVEKTPFRAYVIGPKAGVTRCVKLISSGLDELGIGGKTAAGYGYCRCAEETS